MKAPVIEAWMDKLGDLLQKYNFPPELIFNFDETMIDATGHKTKVLVRSHDPKPFTENDRKLQHISLGLCISASGGFICPLLILPLKYLPNLTPQVENFFSFAGQQNGFTDNKIWHNWIEKDLIPHINKVRTQIGKPDQKALLIVDSHSTRKHQPTITLFEEHNVMVIILPAHSSTIIQPLDLSVNGEFKRLLKLRFKTRDNEDGPTKRSRLLFVSVECLQGALLGMYIKDGFARAGIYPFSKKAPLNSSLVKHQIDQIDFSATPKKKPRVSIAGKVLTFGEKPTQAITNPTPNIALLPAPPTTAPHQWIQHHQLPLPRSLPNPSTSF